MATSSVPAVKAALLAMLQARAGLADVTVVWGMNSSTEHVRELVNLGDVKGPQETAALGARRRTEDFDLAVLVSVIREGTQQQPVTERAYEIAGELEAAIRANPTLDGHFAGGGQLIDAQVAGMDLKEIFSDTRREAEITATVRFRARI